MAWRICLVAAFTALLAAPSQTQSRFASFAEIRGVLGQLADILPPELKVPNADDAERAWAGWVERQDTAIRSRLRRGDEETIVNWLLFGTTFTTLPRVPLESSPGGEAARTRLIESRIVDLARALAAPGQDDRRLFALSLLAAQGFSASERDRARLIARLGDLVRSVVAERAELAREIQAIRQADDASAQFAARSKLFRDRGLSLDTSLRPGVAIDLALAELRRRGLVTAGSIREVAVVGPGLDFTDKTSGYDFYPQQTLQPFTLIDSLVRVGLAAEPEAVRVTTLDISPRVNDHLRRSQSRAAAGQAYLFRLPLDRTVKWKPEVLDYWKAAGNRVGTVTAAAAARVGGTSVDVRTVSVRQSIARRVEPLDLNIVVQRSDAHRFDLVIATNVFVYYDVVEQVLALANVRAMLRPGGLLLSNNALLELPGSGMRSAGYLTVEYSDIQDDGDHIVWYRAE